METKGRKKVYDYPKKIMMPNITQEQAYEELEMKFMIDQFIFEGRNATVFAYGQTGSGKTHTLFGDGVTRDSIRFVLLLG